MTEKKEKRIVASHLFFPLVKSLLGEGYDVKFTVSGISMSPLIRDNTDAVIITAINRSLKKGDIVLFESPYEKDRYILHRITRIFRGGKSLQTTGDGCLGRDMPIKTDCVIAIVNTIIRGNMIIDCSAIKWKFVFFLWRTAFPIRALLIGAINRRSRS
ncbi:hypothetical protein SDC9_148460 [bioreactor metagenome]|uniref:Peptidase S24/S26A/S26B/S26C domain-containing protein n=1 Tax=bioreactor metagenome TaxID=1076179 RepID=A0A645EKL8_9ZZZZ|nr:S26 family signal peptidase [Oscillospiraceae bacterium]